VSEIDRGRAVGALVGSAMGDALGRAHRAGGDGSEFGIVTRDAVVLGEHLRRMGGIDGDGLLAEWQRERREGTVVVGRGADAAALARASTSAVFAASFTTADAMRLACRQAVVTHRDPAAWWGAAVHHALVRHALRGGEPLEVLGEAIDRVPVEVADTFRASLRPEPTAQAADTVWACLADAVAVMRSADGFEHAVHAAAAFGDEVGAVVGALAGARWGIDGIATIGADHVHGTARGRIYRTGDLVELAEHLAG
jgi:ADP-ribosylglycohydrolase